MKAIDESRIIPAIQGREWRRGLRELVPGPQFPIGTRLHPYAERGYRESHT